MREIQIAQGGDVQRLSACLDVTPHAEDADGYVHLCESPQRSRMSPGPAQTVRNRTPTHKSIAVTFCWSKHPTPNMESSVVRVLGLLATVVDAGTGAAIGVGVLAALVRTARLSVRRSNSLESAMSEIRITLGRWLALALELALAADILRTVMIPTWDEIGKLGAIVVLRTALNYFLEREIEQEQKKAEYRPEPAA
jgi:uncharacterized membrane protein